MTEPVAGQIETQDEIGKDPRAIRRRWLIELKLADKREKDWRKEAAEVIRKYRGEKAKKNSFNILYSNTETWRPALYTNAPTPDVRRRFNDRDPLGKCVSEVLSRSISFQVEHGFDENLDLAILDYLLAGRAVVRARYVPSLAQVGQSQEVHEEEMEVQDGHELQEGLQEEVVWEAAPVEFVPFDQFRLGPGKIWQEVCWVGFKHCLRKDEIERQFGAEVADRIKYQSPEDEDAQKDEELFSTAEVWEIWDKDERQVLFISEGYESGPLKVTPDPLELVNFFPCPRPLHFVDDPSSLVPVTPYSTYKEQAEELDRISTRINKLTDACKARGIYDATLKGALSELMRGSDNDLIPADQVAALYDRGGIEGAIWWMPIEQLAKVLAQLYTQRDQCKQTIYEITGISDVLRGATDPNETATAQNLKAQWGGQRVKRMQMAVQKFIRDLVRIQGEIIAEKFSLQTIQAMTGLQYPTEEQNAAQMQQAQMQYQQQTQQAAMQAQQQGQPFQPKPFQAPQLPPSWEQVEQVLRDDAARSFKVDIETDSTIAATQEADAQSLSQLMDGLTKFAPMIASFDVQKAFSASAARRLRMGSTVEDAIDQAQPPPPQQPDPVEQQKLQLEQQKLQAEQQNKQMEMQASGQLEAQKAQQELSIEAQKLEFERQKLQMEIQAQMQIEQMKLEFEAKKFELELQMKREVELSKAAMEHERMEREHERGMTEIETNAVRAEP